MKSTWTWAVLVLSAVWVFYNAVFSGTILYFDSFSYDSLGLLITQGKFADYLALGPTREPLYPTFVAINMLFAQALHVPYTQLILLTQGVVLLLSQFLLARIFDRIKLKNVIAVPLLLYFVISPTVLRSSLIVYSEIITYPFMLLACLVCVNAWEGFSVAYKKYAVLLGLCFLPLIFIKGIFEMIAPVCIIIFAFFLWLRFKSSKPIFFASIAFMTFIVPVDAYKMLNKIYNGHFTVTNRGSSALYGTIARRTMPTTAQEDLAQKYYVLPDKTVCDAKVSTDACAHWFYHLSDQISADKYVDLRAKHLNDTEVDQAFMSSLLQLIVTHPFKMINGMFWEASKLLFWEYPSWGMVILPRDVRQIYEQPFLYPIFLYGINGLSVMLFAATFAVVILNLRKFIHGKDKSLNVLVITFILILAYTVAHSFFFLNERNALPIVPLFLVLYGSLLNHLFSKKCHESKI